MQLKIKDFLTKYGFNGVWIGYQRLDMMNRIAKDYRDVCNDQESRILLALYDETVAGLDQWSSPKCWCKLNSANLSFHKLKHTGFF